MVQEKFWGSLESFLQKKVKLTPGQDYALVAIDDLMGLKELFNSIIDMKWQRGAKGSPVDFRILSSENQFFTDGCICARENASIDKSDLELSDLIIEELRVVLQLMAKSKKNFPEIQQKVENQVNSRMHILFKKKALGTLVSWEIFCDETNNTERFMKEILVATLYYGTAEGKSFQIKTWIDFETMSFRWYRS